MHRRGGLFPGAGVDQSSLRLRTDTEPQHTGTQLPGKRILGHDKGPGASQSRTDGYFYRRGGGGDRLR